MEYIKKGELIEGEIYKVQEGEFSMIGLITLVDNGNNDLYSKRGNATYITTKNELKKDSCWCYIGTNRNITNATSEEKHWLNTCIEQNKFVEYDEAMKSFIPEYVKCINPGGWKQTIKNNNNNLIFDTKIESVNISGNDWKKIIKDTTMSFKPSTKKAYDAQFVVKESEPLPQFKVIETIETITKVENNEGNQFFIGDVVLGGKNKTKSKIISFKYNIDKTTILAITDKTPNIGIGINHLEHYIEPKVEETLLEKAKRLYPIGTKFKAARGGRSLYNVTSISEFRENSDGAICIENDGNGTIYFNGVWGEIIE